MLRFRNRHGFHFWKYFRLRLEYSQSKEHVETVVESYVKLTETNKRGHRQDKALFWMYIVTKKGYRRKMEEWFVPYFNTRDWNCTIVRRQSQWNAEWLNFVLYGMVRVYSNRLSLDRTRTPCLGSPTICSQKLDLLYSGQLVCRFSPILLTITIKRFPLPWTPYMDKPSCRDSTAGCHRPFQTWVPTRKIRFPSNPGH